MSHIIEDRSRAGFVKQYKVLKILGKGGFASVFLVESLDSGSQYACKVINKAQLNSNEEHKRKLITEIYIHSCMDSEYVVKFQRNFEDKAHVYILLEHVPNQSLMDIVQRRKTFTEPEVRLIMQQLIYGVQYLHSQSVIHRDLKLGNLLLDTQMRIKICDFGLATQPLNDRDRKTTICGTPNYTAPEILNQAKSGTGHDFKVDIWAVGVIMFTLLTGRPPFETNDLKETYRRINNIDYRWMPVDHHVSRQAKDLVARILVKDPVVRPSLSDILMHPFFVDMPMPKRLPLCILTRQPTEQELFDEREPLQTTQVNNQPQQSLSQVMQTDDDRWNVLKQDTEPDCAQTTKKVTDFLRVLKYVDYSKKYGIGYILSNGQTGFYFNDATEMLLSADQHHVAYYGVDKQLEACTLVQHEPHLKKKITLLKHFTDYLWKPDNESDGRHTVPAVADWRNKIHDTGGHVYVQEVLSDEYCKVFKLSNGSVQAMFTDMSIINISDGDVLYRSKTGQEDIFELNRFAWCTDEGMKKRCSYVQRLLPRFRT